MKLYPDLTLNPKHAISLVVEQIRKALSPCTVLSNTPIIVPITDNYDNLGYGLEDVCRSPRYAHYVPETTNMYRTQMTSQIPSLLRPGLKEDIYLIPGIVYRRDVTDRYHVPAPHQMDIWALSKSYTYTELDLRELIAKVLTSILPGCDYRVTPTNHPYTDHGLEVEVKYDGRYVEVLECGMAGSAILKQHGKEDYTGLAMGMGLDRIVMLLKGLPDIRLLRAESAAEQMENLDQYIPQSKEPVIRRDMSIAMTKGTEIEDICSLLEEVDQEALIQDVSLLSKTSYEEIHPNALARLGMLKGQENYLLRITLQSLDRTLRSSEAHALYQAAYKKLHQGTNWVYME